RQSPFRLCREACNSIGCDFRHLSSYRCWSVGGHISTSNSSVEIPTCIAFHVLFTMVHDITPLAIIQAV
ncbi:hypothetical protein ACH0BK_29485, partial [Priestia megaterium]|uniref:hypothetical protein n=1 Tax=Priestia megaterium TaxID=1404 RepID=UPI00387933D4